MVIGENNDWETPVTDDSTGSQTILIIDDDRVNSLVLRRVLEPEGYLIIVANDGESALGLFAQGLLCDTVILDRRMPGLDGIEVLQHMKKIPIVCDIPVVMATDMNSSYEIWEGVKNGAFYYLSKPLDMGLLLQIVAAAVGEGATKKRLWTRLESTCSAIGLIDRGLFRYQTMRQCEHLAGLLANSCPNPKRVSIGLYELMINALEHGNLGISYDDKTALVDSKTWEMEVRRREVLPENQGKFVAVTLARTPRKIRFRIQDRGDGFPWKNYLEATQDRVFDNHGRGILLAKWEAFDRITYQGNGNCVVAEILIQ
jgi:CheY-like chemotaxis protein